MAGMAVPRVKKARDALTKSLFARVTAGYNKAVPIVLACGTAVLGAFAAIRRVRFAETKTKIFRSEATASGIR